jgi:DNA repair ATPase RecN
MRTCCRLLVLWLALPVLAALPQRNPQGELPSLKEHARTAKPADATLANARVVRQEIEIADQCFKDGDVDKAQAAVDDAVHYAELADAALQKNSKHLKEAEIIMREAGRRLEEIRRSLAFDDQAPVQQAEDRLEKIRRDLLAQMFQAK